MRPKIWPPHIPVLGRVELTKYHAPTEEELGGSHEYRLDPAKHGVNGAPVFKQIVHDSHFPRPLESRVRNRLARAFKKNSDQERLQNVFISTFAGNEKLLEALAVSDNPKVRQLLADMVNPRFKRWTTGYLAAKNNIRPQELAELWRSHELAKGMITLTGGAPGVAAQVVESCQSRVGACPRCDGFGDIQRPGVGDMMEVRVCPECDGTGKVLKPGDIDNRRLLFKAIGWADSKVIVNQTTNMLNLGSVLQELGPPRPPIINITPESDL
jgi:hypothetical protein